MENNLINEQILYKVCALVGQNGLWAARTSIFVMPFFFLNIDNKIVLPESVSESGRILWSMRFLHILSTPHPPDYDFTFSWKGLV